LNSFFFDCGAVARLPHNPLINLTHFQKDRKDVCAFWHKEYNYLVAQVRAHQAALIAIANNVGQGIKPNDKDRG
jgi:adenosyl cobinamide kinase/adenosyl cobinamide phosphate guanylyltransferase